ncbi:hypothetical protein MNBD_GAMMA16-372 [hydrothermal vent metagenome]|uniref:OmpH family outer membrane protein n=1 Tax=hydrothermal vent metagenome TaxID=652676 RepID=A0A3B0Z6N5_9ZZZZ
MLGLREAGSKYNTKCVESVAYINEIVIVEKTVLKRKRYFVALGILLLLWGSPAVNAELKLGYVNAARLLEQAPQAGEATQQLKKEFAPREESIIASQVEAEGLEKEMRRNADVMTEARRRKLEREIVASKRDLRRVQDEFREDLNFRRNEELAKLQQLVKEIIEAVGEDDGYDLILFEGIAFANQRIDLTDKILERLKTEMKDD